MVQNVLLVCLLSLLATRTGVVCGGGSDSDYTNPHTPRPLNCTASDFCRCEGTYGGKEFTFDIGYILKSFKTTGIPDTSPEGRGKYTYTLSPCSRPLSCVSGGTANGLACQEDFSGRGITYVARDTKPADWTIYSLDPLEFVVMYGDGDKSEGPVLTRQAHVIFSARSTSDIQMFQRVLIANPKVLTLNYVFRVSGPSVTPVPPVPLTCEPVSGDEFCSCRGSGFTIDLRHTLSLPVLAGVVCFVIGLLTGYCKRRNFKFQKFGADREQEDGLFLIKTQQLIRQRKHV